MRKISDSPPAVPPVLRSAKSRRFAVGLNCAIPGAGQYYLGQKALGVAFMVVWLVILVIAVRLLVGAIGFYFNVAGNEHILDPGVLEQLAEKFHLTELFAAMAAYFVVKGLSIALLYLPRRGDDGGNLAGGG